MSEEIEIIKEMKSAWDYGGCKEFGSMYLPIQDEIRRLHAESQSLSRHVSALEMEVQSAHESNSRLERELEQLRKEMGK